MKKIEDLSLEEYNTLKASGLFWVLYPKTTGNFDFDRNPPKVIAQDEIDRNKSIACEQYCNIASGRER